MIKTKYEIQFNKAYLKDLKKIPKNDQKKIQKKILELSEEPRPESCKKLQGGSTPPLYRIRCGDYRIVYTVSDDVLLVLVIAVGHRGKIYQEIK